MHLVLNLNPPLSCGGVIVPEVAFNSEVPHPVLYESIKALNMYIYVGIHIDK